MLYEFIRKVNICPIEIPSKIEITPKPEDQPQSNIKATSAISGA